MEIFLVLLVIIAQAYSFYLTFGKIRLLEFVFAQEGAYTTRKHTLLQSDLDAVAPARLLQELTRYEHRAAELQDDPSAKLILVHANGVNSKGAAIVHSINLYLLRNSGAAPDFNLIKDVAERNNDALESEINSMLFIPLYLGLLGTLLGIVFGLSHISGLSLEQSTVTGNLLDESIPVLLGGVKVAMIASFTGLLLSIVLSGLFYRRAKNNNQLCKDAFFTFLQVELLPSLNTGVADMLYGFQANLMRFTQSFELNLQKLSSLMNKNSRALKSQEAFVETLSKMDIMEFASANAKVLSSLKTTVSAFGDFSEYALAVSSSLHKADQLIVHVDKMLSRTDRLNQVAEQLIGAFHQNRDLMDFLKSHFSALDSSKQLIGAAVSDTSEYVLQLIEELRSFTEAKIAAVRSIEIKEADLMQEQYPERWKHLGELKHLNPIMSELAQLKESNTREMKVLQHTLDELNEKFALLEEGVPVKLKMPSVRDALRKLTRKSASNEEI